MIDANKYLGLGYTDEDCTGRAVSDGYMRLRSLRCGHTCLSLLYLYYAHGLYRSTQSHAIRQRVAPDEYPDD